MDATTMKQGLAIRCMLKADIPIVAAIECLSYDEPWSYDDIASVMRDRQTYGYVAEMEGHVVGFVIYDRNRRSFDILSLAVSPAFRRQGVGRQLVWHVKRKLRNQYLETIVSERNVSAQIFLRQLNFRWIHTMPTLYDKTTDGYLFRFFSEWNYAQPN